MTSFGQADPERRERLVPAMGVRLKDGEGTALLMEG